MSGIVLGKSGQLACHSPPSPSLQHVSSYYIACGCCYAFPCVMTFSFKFPKLNQFHCFEFSTKLQIDLFFSPLYLFVSPLFLLIPPPTLTFSFFFPFSLLSLSLTVQFFSFMPCFLFFLQKQPVSTLSAWIYLPWMCLNRISPVWRSVHIMNVSNNPLLHCIRFNSI